jgi:hypothetical protein
VALNPNEPAGIAFKNGAVAVKLEPYADQLSPEQAKKVKTYAKMHRESEQKRKEREKAKTEAQRQAQVESQKRADDAIRQRIRRANPFATPEQIEALLPKVREAEMLKRTLEGADDYRKSVLMKWGAE